MPTRHGKCQVGMNQWLALAGARLDEQGRTLDASVARLHSARRYRAGSQTASWAMPHENPRP